MSILFLAAGSIAIFIAIFANRLGFDRSPGWGRGRLALLFIGLICYGISALGPVVKRYLIRREQNQRIASKMQPIFDVVNKIILSPTTEMAFGILICAGISIYALWYSSANRFPAFPVTSNDYIQLGEAFLHGQTALLEQPGPELKALANPYDYQQRLNTPYHWDASYYEGKYYLYWGPVPALVFAAAEGLAHAPPSASFMVDLAYIGLSLILLIIFFLISRRFFPTAARYSQGLFTLLALVNLPFLFLLGNPQIYHTSIIFGQFFLLLGLLGWILYDTLGKAAWLILAGLGWGLAIGSRVNLAVSVAIYVIFAVIWFGRESGWKPSWKKEGSLLIPLSLCMAGLGVYNFERFGNPFETGQKYQLTIPTAHSTYFSISYLPTNLYTYLIYPINLAGKFPFVKSTLFDFSLLPHWINVPKAMSFDHNIFGVFSSVPGSWLIALGIPLLILAGSSVDKHRALSPSDSNRNLLFAMIATAGLGQFFFLLVFFFGAERYIPDFYISLVIGTAMLAWWIDEMIKTRVRIRFVFWLIVTGLTIWTAAIGIFGGFGVPPELFRSFNPPLYNQIASGWNDRYEVFHAILTRLLSIFLNGIHP
jgi:hypothetical protein